MNKKEEMVACICAICVLSITFVFICFYIGVLVRYGNTPPNELPSWVHWFMTGYHK